MPGWSVMHALGSNELVYQGSGSRYNNMVCAVDTKMIVNVGACIIQQGKAWGSQKMLC